MTPSDQQTSASGNPASSPRRHLPRFEVPTLRAATLTALALIFIWLTANILLVLFAGILLGAMFRGLAQLVQRATGLSIGWSLLTVFGLTLAAAGLGGWWMASHLGEQMDILWQRVPPTLRQVEEYIRQFQWGQTLLDYLPDQLGPDGADIGGPASAFLSVFIGALANVVIILFIGLYLAVSPDPYTNGTIRLFPMEKRERVADILDQLGYTLQRWLLGRLLTMVVVGVLTGLVLFVMGVPLALPLALLTTLLTFVPYLGPLTAAVPIIALSLTEGASTLLWVLSLYFLIQNIEGYILTPMIQRWVVRMPPAVVLGAIALLGTLFGPMGLVVATPLAAVLLVLVRTAYLQDVLGEPKEDVRETTA
ncbi:AI-2E family transporter [Telmatospirillum sp. J64-1]|uniref:AI-2E family transporter n=1 Tax=Telmatospirillum sp. J64-1 TaxID=2502183 RepID=UPI00115C817B|nr:AI-2E family transporter [Telmatospirillum sp. J64-1]